MSPLVAAALGSIIRSLLNFLAGWLVARGIWSQAEASTYVMAGSLAALSFGWSVFQHYRGRIKFLTALDMPAGTTEERVKAEIAVGMGATLAVLLAVGLLAGSVSITGCAKAQPTVNPIAAHQQQVVKVLHAVKQVGLVVEQVQLGEQNLFLAGQIPSQVHADIQQAFKETADAVLIATDTLAKAVATTDPATVVHALSDGLKRISLALGHLTPKQGAQLAGWIDTAAALIEVAVSQ